MEIEGPLVIEVVDDTAKNSRKVNVNFRAAFQSQSTVQQTASMKTYIRQLTQFAQDLDVDSADYQGGQLILSLCEQVLPYIAEGSIDLTQAVSLEMDIGVASPQSYINLTGIKLN